MDSWILQTRRLLDPLGLRRRRMLGDEGAETTLDRLVHAEPTQGPPHPEARLEAAAGFTLRLGRALLSFGLPAQRLEEALQRLAEALGYSIDCFSTPTALMMTMSDTRRRRTRVIRVQPGDTDLERLNALHALVGRVERHELSPSEASTRIKRIVARRSRYPSVVEVLSTGVVSASGSILLGGGTTDVLPALALGALVGALTRLAQRYVTLGRILPALAAMIITIAARLFAAAGLEVHESVLVLASIIALLPGFTLTVATMELAAANVVSGTSRMVGALSTLVQLGFGVALGHRLAQMLPVTASAAAAMPDWTVWIAYGTAALGFAFLLKAAPRDVPLILGAAAVSVAGARFGRAWLGPEIGAFLGAVLIGLVSHVHARLADRPALLLLTPGILMLVPGSVGFLSVASMLQADVLVALQTAFRMLLIATSLAAGVLVATVAVPPRRAL